VSGFVASPGDSSDPSAETQDLVDGGDFFPPLSIAQFRDSVRVGTIVTDVRARDALRGGLLTVRRELRAWSAAKIAAGYPTLDAVDAEQVDFESEYVLLYQRAVFAYAAADLAETHNEISATKEGEKRLDERSLSADEHRRNGLHAIRDILGATRTGVELI
jgi:hypothetical protein